MLTNSNNLRTWIRKFIFTLYILLFLVGIAYAQDVINQPIAEINLGNSIKQVAWRPDGQILVVATTQGAKVYTATLQQLSQIDQNVIVYSASWSPDGNRLALTNENAIEIWNWDNTAKTLSLFATLQENETQVLVSWSPDGKWLASMGISQPPADVGLTTSALGSIHIWNALSWTLERVVAPKYVVDTQYSLVNLLDWNPNFTSMIVGVGNEGTVDNGEISSSSGLIAFIIDANTGDQVQTVPLLGPVALSVSWQPTGNLLAVGTDLGVQIYDLSTNSLVNDFPAGSNIDSLDWNPDGRSFAGNNVVSSVAINNILGFFYKTAEVSSVQWNPDGESLTTASVDGNLRVENANLLPGFDLLPSATPSIISTAAGNP